MIAFENLGSLNDQLANLTHWQYGHFIVQADNPAVYIGQRKAYGTGAVFTEQWIAVSGSWGLREAVTLENFAARQ